MAIDNDPITMRDLFEKIDQRITSLKDDLVNIDVYNYTGNASKIVAKKDRAKLNKIIKKINQLKPTQKKLQLISHTQIKVQRDKITAILDEVSEEFAQFKEIHDQLIAVIKEYVDIYIRYIEHLEQKLEVGDVFDFDLGTWEDDKLWKLFSED